MKLGGGLEGSRFGMDIAIDVAEDAAYSIFIKDEELGDYDRFCSSTLAS